MTLDRNIKISNLINKAFIDCCHIVSIEILAYTSFIRESSEEEFTAFVDFRKDFVK